MRHLQLDFFFNFGGHFRKRSRGSLQFLLEPGHNQIETGVASERIPEGMQFQLAVAHPRWESGGSRQLFESHIFLTGPGGSDGKVLDHMHAVDCVLRDRKQLDCSSTFLQSLLFLSQGGIDQAENT